MDSGVQWEEAQAPRSSQPVGSLDVSSHLWAVKEECGVSLGSQPVPTQHGQGDILLWPGHRI